VGKVIKDTNEKLNVLALLNKEFFEDIKNKISKDGHDAIYANFGS